MVAGSNDGLKAPRALGTRVLAASMGLLALFLGLTFAGLDLAFRRAASQALEDVLDSQVLGLLAAADEGPGHTLELPPGLPETRLSRPGSGLYGRVATPRGEPLWISRSALGLTLPPSGNLDPGRPEYRTHTLADGDRIMLVDLRVEWEFEDGEARDFVFTVASSMGSYRAQIARYRARLGGWFALMTLLLGAAQLLILRYVLRPLRQAEREVEEIETGLRERLSEGYPAELEALARNVNELIEGERARSTRYRESLDNLAHSLKTPLAVVRSQIEASGPVEERAGIVIEQVERMQGIVDYQLRRAAAGGASGGARVAIGPIADATLAALRKVYADRSIEVAATIQPGATFRGERGDLAEILGNLLDNAFKWCRGKIRLDIRHPPAPGRRPALEIVVEDDGPGLDPARAQDLIRRGERGDEAVPGQGIGLAVVNEIVGARGGELEFGVADTGGGRVVVRLPGDPRRPPA
jgi:two-component system sensor histidine kinase PhoQ